MKRDRLKPYVYKIKGAKNYALFDILNGNFYRLEPEGDLKELRKNLLEAGLIFQTEGCVPFKVEIDLHDELNTVQVRELQLRLNGSGEDNCRTRKKKKEPKREMDLEILDSIKEAFHFIPVKKVRVEAENLEFDKVKEIISGVKFDSLDLFIEKDVDKKSLKTIEQSCEKENKTFSYHKNGKKEVSEMKVEAYDFFYNRQFNHCLGHQVAIDCTGEIKPCLWSNDVLGNIKKNNIHDMIISGVFDKYWELTKDKIEICKDCELRYACTNCPNSFLNNGSHPGGHPVFCNYDPYTGAPCARGGD